MPAGRPTPKTTMTESRPAVDAAWGAHRQPAYVSVGPVQRCRVTADAVRGVALSLRLPPLVATGLVWAVQWVTRPAWTCPPRSGRPRLVAREGVAAADGVSGGTGSGRRRSCHGCGAHAACASFVLRQSVSEACHGLRPCGIVQWGLTGLKRWSKPIVLPTFERYCRELGLQVTPRALSAHCQRILQ